MNNQKNVLSAILVIGILSILAFAWYSSMPARNDLDYVTPTPTPKTTITVSPTVTVTPIAGKKVNEYTSSKAYLTLKFTKPMYVRETTLSSTKGEIIASINPISSDYYRYPNGLAVMYEAPSIEGKGGACPSPNKLRSNSVLDQTLEFCESQTSMSGGYLMNKSAKVEYAFFIEAKGPTEYALYRLVITEGLTLINK